MNEPKPGGPQGALLPDGRLHLHHGPIDLVIEAFGAAPQVRQAYQQAWLAFENLLQTLVDELPALRMPVANARPALRGLVARRMGAAVWPHRADFVTPMAAVAGAVADQVLAAMVAGGGLRRAYVNDGGDIAVHLDPGECFQTGLVSRLDRPAVDGVCVLRAAMPVRGIATSGRGGRSLSLGIADAVTALAQDAAAADVAATLIANAVNVAHPAVRRVPACELDPDSDLGDRLVTEAVGPLPPQAVRAALDAGAGKAQAMLGKGLIHGAVLALAGRLRLVGASCVHVATPKPEESTTATQMARATGCTRAEDTR